MELPIDDGYGVRLETFTAIDDTAPPFGVSPATPVCSIIVVGWNHQVLIGFNAARQQWELPGGSLEVDESAKDAALRELAEETGIVANRVSLVARAVMKSAEEAITYVAEVFGLLLKSEPELFESEELTRFVWWNPASGDSDGLSQVDAEIARRCLPLLVGDEK